MLKTEKKESRFVCFYVGLSKYNRFNHKIIVIVYNILHSLMALTIAPIVPRLIMSKRNEGIKIPSGVINNFPLACLFLSTPLSEILLPCICVWFCFPIIMMYRFNHIRKDCTTLRKKCINVASTTF